MITKTARLKRVQGTAVAILTVAGAINFLDRSTLAIANGAVRAELGLSATQMGMLLSAFLFAYALSQLPAGLLIDRFGPRVMIGAGMLLWSIAQLFGGLAGSMVAMLLARIALGILETPLFPSVPKIISEWFAIGERGRPQGIFQTCTTVGPALAPPVLTALMLALGWRGMFMIMGAAGMLVAVAWYLRYRDRRDVALTDEETAYLDQGTKARSLHSRITFAEWRALLCSRTGIGMTLGFMGVVYPSWLFLTWLPAYMQQELHLSVARTGWIVSIPYVAGTLGMVSSGFIADALMARGVTAINSRKWPICIGLVLAAVFTVFVAYATIVAEITALLSCTLFFLYIASGGGWMLVSIAAPRHLVGSLGSMMTFGAFFAGAFAPLITGIVVDATHSFVNAFLSSAAVSLAATLAYVILVRRPIEERGTAGLATLEPVTRS